MVLLSAIAAGFTFLLLRFVLVNTLGQDFLIEIVYWETGLAFLLLVSYGITVAPIVFSSYLVSRLTVFSFTYSVGTLFILAFFQTLSAMLFALIATHLFHLNLRYPQPRDIVVMFIIVVIYLFCTLWLAYFIILVIEGAPALSPLAGLLIWMTVATFVFFSSGLLFASIVVPIIDHLLCKYTPQYSHHLADENRLYVQGSQHQCLLCDSCWIRSWKSLFVYLVNLVYISLLLWFSSTGPLMWYTLTPFPFSFYFILQGYLWSVLWSFSVFIATWFSAAVFGTFPTPGVSLAFFIAAITVVVLFAAINSDHLRKAKREREEFLNSEVAKRTRQLEQVRDELEELLATKSQFLRGVSHEAVTPLNQMYTAISLLQGLTEKPLVQNKTSTALINVNRLNYVVDDCLLATRLEWDGSLPMAASIMSYPFYSLLDEVGGSICAVDSRLMVYMIQEHPSPKGFISLLDASRVSKLLQLVLRICFSFSNTAIVNVLQYSEIPMEKVPENQLVENAKGWSRLLLDFSPGAPRTQPSVFSESGVASRFHPSALVAQLTLACGFSACFSDDAHSIRIEIITPFAEEIDYTQFVPTFCSKYEWFTLLSEDPCTVKYISGLLSSILTNIASTDIRKNCPEKHIFIVDELHPVEKEHLNEIFTSCPSSSYVFVGKSRSTFNFIDFPITPRKLFLFLESFATHLPTKSESSQPFVLVVDDMKMNVKLLVAMLKKLGVSSDEAFDGREAFLKVKDRWAENRPYRLILMDILMPFSGIDATRLIRNYERTKSMGSIIVAVSAHATEDAALRAEMETAQFDDFVKKPLQLNKLKLLLTKAGMGS
ncbi:hypothetical protein P9112_009770 [Eukaryota sp. TZLM1-RC]